MSVTGTAQRRDPVGRALMAWDFLENVTFEAGLKFSWMVTRQGRGI